MSNSLRRLHKRRNWQAYSRHKDQDITLSLTNFSESMKEAVDAFYEYFLSPLLVAWRSIDWAPLIEAISSQQSPDAYTEKFELERTDHCWKAINDFDRECGKPSVFESETGLCIEHLTEMRDRWTS